MTLKNDSQLIYRVKKNYTKSNLQEQLQWKEDKSVRKTNIYLGKLDLWF